MLPALWWFRTHEDGGFTVLAGAALATLVVTVILRMALPKRRPSLARAPARTVIDSAKNACGGAPAGQERSARNAEPRVDHLFDPPLAVIGNLRFTRGRVYADYLIDGLPLVLRPLHP